VPRSRAEQRDEGATGRAKRVSSADVPESGVLIQSLTTLIQKIALEKHEHHPQTPWRRQGEGQVQAGGRQSA